MTIKDEIRAQLETANFDTLLKWWEGVHRLKFQDLDDEKIYTSIYPEYHDLLYALLEQRVNRILQSDWFQAELEDVLHDAKNEIDRKRNPYKYHGVHPSQF